MDIVGDLFGSDAPSISVPQKSPEELALLREQTEMLREQRDTLRKQLEQQNLLQPLLFEELGLRPKYEDRPISGTYTGPNGSWKFSNEAELREAMRQNIISQNANPADYKDVIESQVKTLIGSGKLDIAAFEAAHPDAVGAVQATDGGRVLTGYEKTPLTTEQQKLKDVETRFNELTLAQLENELKNAPQSREIQDRINQRTLAALKGELPVDPSLLRSLDEQETTLKDTMSRNLGPGWETSTPGIQAMAEFKKRREELLDAARRGDLSLGEQLSTARSATQFGEATSGINVADVSERIRSGKFGDVMRTGMGTLPFLDAGTRVAGGFSGPLSSYANDRMMQFQANVSSAQMKSQQDAALMSGLGNMVGMLTYGKVFGKG